VTVGARTQLTAKVAIVDVPKSERSTGRGVSLSQGRGFPLSQSIMAWGGARERASF